MSAERCAYTVRDEDDVDQPCDRPATGWRWYQDCGHEPLLDAACYLHENEGGYAVREIVKQRDAARDIAAALEAQVAHAALIHSPGTFACRSCGHPNPCPTIRALRPEDQP